MGQEHPVTRRLTHTVRTLLTAGSRISLIALAIPLVIVNCTSDDAPEVVLRADTVVISGVAHCDRCIEFHSVVALGSEMDSLSPHPLAHVASSGNRYYVGPVIGQASIAVYDSGGTYRGVLGREGDGPGEVRSIRGIAVDSNENIYALDGRKQRIVVFSPDGGSSRTISLPALVTEFALAADSQIIIVAALSQGTEMGPRFIC